MFVVKIIKVPKISAVEIYLWVIIHRKCCSWETTTDDHMSKISILIFNNEFEIGKIKINFVSSFNRVMS